MLATIDVPPGRGVAQSCTRGSGVFEIRTFNAEELREELSKLVSLSFELRLAGD
jgi:hypothetical protein